MLRGPPLAYERDRHSAQVVHHIFNFSPKAVITRTLGHGNLHVERRLHGVDRVVIDKHVGIPLRGIAEISQVHVVVQMPRRFTQAARKLHALIEPVHEKRVEFIFFGRRKARRRRSAARTVGIGAARTA